MKTITVHPAALALGAGFLALAGIRFDRSQDGLAPQPSSPGSQNRTAVQICGPNVGTPIKSIPFTISRPGSYYLTRNLTGEAGEVGIRIASDDVTLDLRGLTLRGVPGSLEGILADQGSIRFNVTIRDGVVRDWGAAGVDGVAIKVGSMRGIHALSNGHSSGGDGIWFGSQNVSVEDCHAHDNADDGLRVGINATVVGCTARQNGDDGIDLGAGSTIRDCAATVNDGHGIRVSSQSTVSGCSGSSNDLDGINCGVGVTVTDCVADFNRGSGIVALLHSTLRGNTSWQNDIDGFSAGEGCTISECTAGANGRGIVFGDNSKVTGCTASENSVDGLLTTGRGSQIVGNVVGGNPGVGITLGTASIRNRVEDNHFHGNGIGLLVAGTTNLIFGNTATANSTNYVITTNNRVGPIVIPPNSAAVNGNTGGSGMGTTNPWANFSF